jgi:hypothetical protein
MIKTHIVSVIPSPDNSNQVRVTIQCPVTQTTHTLTVGKAAYESWLAGEYVQVAFPRLSADDRERLISGISPEGWNQMFGPQEE